MRALVDIDMASIDTNDLIAELEHRRAPISEYVTSMKIETIIGRLYELGCPISIIEQIEEWKRQPEANALKLKEWKKLCGVL